MVCEIGTVDGTARAFVGRGSAAEVQKCYADWALVCVLGQFERGLLVGAAGGDAFTHLAARDAIGSMVLAGVPPGFRLAVVALDPFMVTVYDAVVVEAGRRGLVARRFRDEEEALKWLAAPP
jgi:hypothetical protein